MDRDKRWERVQLAYNALVKGVGPASTSATQAIKENYAQNITDEFIKPTVITHQGKPMASIQEGDAVLCFNFRTDRCREITEVLTQKDFPDFGMKKLNLHYTTLTKYDESFKNVPMFQNTPTLKNDLENILPQILKNI